MASAVNPLFASLSGVQTLPKHIRRKLEKGKPLKPREILRAQMAGVAFPSSLFEFQKQQDLFGIVKPLLEQLANQGFSPEELAALNSQAIEGTATQFSGAREALVGELSRRGLRTGGLPISGEGLRRTAELGSAQAISTSQALRDVLLANARQRLSNAFNVSNIASGFPANPNSALQSTANLATTFDTLKQNNPSLASQLSSFGQGSLGSLLGGAQNALFGALGKALKGLKLPGFG